MSLRRPPLTGSPRNHGTFSFRRISGSGVLKGVRSPKVWARTRPPPGRRTLLICPKKIGMLTWVTRSKRSLVEGKPGSIGDPESDPSFGVEADLGLGFANHCFGQVDSPDSRGRILPGQKQGAGPGAAAEVEYALRPDREGIKAGREIRQVFGEPAEVRSSQSDAARSKKRPTEPLTTGHAHGARAARRQMVLPMKIVFRSGEGRDSGT